MTDIDRSPSRLGFTRRRTPDLECAESIEDDDDQWEFASALLVPSCSTSSEGSNDSDETVDPEAEHDEHKPSLPARTVSLIHLPLHITSLTQSGHVDPVHDDVVIQNMDFSESCAVVDHGLSRSALTHLKGFWSARQDEYARLEAQIALAEASAYDGIWEPRHRSGLRVALCNRFPKPAMRSAYDVDRTVRPNLDAPIYPRTGDLTTLRDARLAALDRAFCNLPLNSINKILFLHDMLQRSTTPSPESPTFPLPKDSSSSQEEDSFVDISLESHTSCESTSAADSSFCSSFGCQGEKCDDEHSLHDVYTAECSRAWEVDWTVRWKVLLEQVKEDPASPVDEKAFWAALNPPKPAKFFIGDEEDDFFGADSDGEDEDYGVMVTKPSYGVTADSLSREFLQSLCNFRVGVGI